MMPGHAGEVVAQLVVHGQQAVAKNRKRILSTDGFRVRKCRACGKPSGRLYIGDSDQYAKWKKLADPQIIGQWIGRSPIDFDVTAQILIFTKTKQRPDMSNAYQGIEDAMQRCGVLEDDRLIRNHNDSEWAKDKDDPRIEVTLRKWIED